MLTFYYNHSTMIITRKLALLLPYLLIYRYYANFYYYPTNVLYFFSGWGFSPGYHNAFNCHVYLVSSDLWQFLSLSFFLTDQLLFWMSFNLGLFSIFSIFRLCIFDKNTTKKMYHSQCIISGDTWCQCVIHGNGYLITWLRCLPVLSNECCDCI